MVQAKSLKDKLKTPNKPIVQGDDLTKPRAGGPLWKGPEGKGPQGGITQSMIGAWLSDPETFRLENIEGIQPTDKPNFPIEFGNMWHAAEEALAGGKGWEKAMLVYATRLMAKHPTDKSMVQEWYVKCASTFPEYVNFWRKHPDVKDRTPLIQEGKFDVPYTLSSGRTVRLRGKWDSVDVIGKGKEAAIYLQENKTKSTIDRAKIERQLKFDLQTMLYLVTLKESQNTLELNQPALLSDYPIKGVRYNVIRRSAHKVGAKETLDTFSQRLTGLIKEEPKDWFDRWKVEITPLDVTKFQKQCLNPILEQICIWYDRVITREGFDVFGGNHFRFPYGIYNPKAEGGFGDLDAYMENGSTVGLRRADSLFPELQDEEG